MPTFVISYDLKKHKNYPRLYECLNQWSAKRLVESFWLAELRGPAAAVRDILLQYVDHDDALVVIEVTGDADWAVIRAQSGGIDKLKRASPPVPLNPPFASSTLYGTILEEAVSPSFNALRRF